MIRAAALALGMATAAAAQPVAPPDGALRLDGLPALPIRGDARPDTTTAPPDAWLAYDKALHAGASFLLTLSGQYVLVDKGALSNAEALPAAAGSALALGLLKEIADSRRQRHPHFCWRDLAADAAGVAVGAAVVAL